jgi:hypothetical protein
MPAIIGLVDLGDRKLTSSIRPSSACADKKSNHALSVSAMKGWSAKVESWPSEYQRHRGIFQHRGVTLEKRDGDSRRGRAMAFAARELPETNRLMAFRRSLTATSALAKLAAMIPPLEIYTVKHGEDRLAKITARRIGEIISRSWLVPSAKSGGCRARRVGGASPCAICFPPNW